MTDLNRTTLAHDFVRPVLILLPLAILYGILVGLSGMSPNESAALIMTTMGCAVLASPPLWMLLNGAGAAVGWFFAARVLRCDDCGFRRRDHLRGLFGAPICPPPLLRPYLLRPYLERAALHDRYCGSCYKTARRWRG